MLTRGIADVSFAVTVTMLAMSLVVGIAFFQIYAVIAMFLAGSLMGATRKN